MTLLEALHDVDVNLPNTVEEGAKIRWISRLDAMAAGVLRQYEGTLEFTGYTADTPKDTVLLIPSPYEESYLRYLEAQIHYHRGEIDRYNNAIVLFNNAFSAYRKWICREHRPLGRGRFRM